ncbi:MAG: formylglycine-generating enzyme family protein [Planctomycetia bacterium]|nr:formylglycine-generating enzyme family protein [Planctomycetia bacterium]
MQKLLALSFVLVAAVSASALPRVSVTDRRAAIAKDAPAANPQGKTRIDGYGELPNVFTNSLGARFILIKPGKFIMGKAPDQGEASTHGSNHPHEVTISKPFYLGETEVTNALHGLQAAKPDARDGAEDGERAVAGVNYFDAIDGILRLSEKEGRRYRLPTEAEFEYAARAGTTTGWYYGNDPKRHDELEWAGHRGGEKYGDSPRPVAWKKPNPWGLYDMLGNCIEYVADWAGDYPTKAVTDPTGPENADPRFPYRVKRSGGYRYGDNACYSRMIKGVDGWRNGRIGYRLAFSAADLAPVQDREAFAALIRRQRIANFLAGTMDNPKDVRRHLAAGKVSGGWGLDWDQALEYLTKAKALDPGSQQIGDAIAAYLAFLDETEKAVDGKFKATTDAIAAARPKIRALLTANPK